MEALAGSVQALRVLLSASPLVLAGNSSAQALEQRGRVNYSLGLDSVPRKVARRLECCNQERAGVVLLVALLLGKCNRELGVSPRRSLLRSEWVGRRFLRRKI